MAEFTGERYRRLCVGLVLLAVSAGVGLDRLLGSSTSLPGEVKVVLAAASSTALFRVLVTLAQVAVAYSDRAMQIYVGSTRFWRGMWHYTSELDGRTYLGIWRIEQDLFGVRVKAFGLDDRYRRRFTAFSVSDALSVGVGGVFEIVNARTDYSEGDVIAFSRTRFTPDRPSSLKKLLTGPLVMRGETVIFGSGLSGNVHQNVVLVRHGDVKSEEELIAKLRRKGIRHEG